MDIVIIFLVNTHFEPKCHFLQSGKWSLMAILNHGWPLPTLQNLSEVFCFAFKLFSKYVNHYQKVTLLWIWNQYKLYIRYLWWFWYFCTNHYTYSSWMYGALTDRDDELKELSTVRKLSRYPFCLWKTVKMVIGDNTKEQRCEVRVIGTLCHRCESCHQLVSWLTQLLLWVEFILFLCVDMDILIFLFVLNQEKTKISANEIAWEGKKTKISANEIFCLYSSSAYT